MSNVATTGEILNRGQIAHWRELQFVVKNSKVSLKGSLPKHFEGGTNYKDFTLKDIQATVKELAETFYFDPQQALINFIEIGLNIPLENNPTKLIKNILLYRNKPFESLHVKGKGIGRRCETQQFTIKIYNKSLQFGLDESLLRFEVKVKRMKYLERFGIYGLTLQELTKADTYKKLKTMLLNVWAGILLYNPSINPDQTTNTKDRELLIAGRFAEFWGTINRHKRHREIKRFSELAGGENIKNEIAELITENCNKITTCTRSIQSEKNQHNNHLRITAECIEMQQNNTTIEGYFVTRCLVTDLPIYNQRPGTKYLSAKGVQWYFENDPETYRNKLECLLTEKWKEKYRAEPDKIWFNEIYHKIRCKQSNRRRNPINNVKRSYRNLEAKGLKLWPTKSLITKEKLELILK